MMEREKSTLLNVLTVLALAALPGVSCCHLGARALPPTVVCGAEGRLPDPTDCRYYMDCTRNSDGSYSSNISMCTNGKYYNSCEGDCSKATPPNNCPVNCETDKEGTPIVSDDNKSVYVVCIKTGDNEWMLNVTKCPGDNEFDVAEGCTEDPADCSVNGGTSDNESFKCNATGYFVDQKNCSRYYYCSSDSDAEPYEGECPPNQYYMTYNRSCVEFKCTEPGYFSDPANCSSYYYCAADSTKTHGTCPSGGHFNTSVGRCMPGDCNTVCPGSGSDTGCDFTCTSTGSFPDPLDCTSYYTCDPSLQVTCHTCENGHFDSAVGGCLTGSCPEKLVPTTLGAEVQSLYSVSSLSLQHEETTISVSSSHKKTLQLPRA